MSQNSNWYKSNLKTSIMQKLFITAVLLSIFSITAQAQKGSGFGIKAGLNYNANGSYIASISDNAQNPDRNIGYHFGVFGKIGNQFYLRPELVYTQTKSDYSSENFSMKKLDLPLLLGIKVIGPLHVFAGPAFQYIINSDFGGRDIKNIDNDFSVGLNFGVGVNLNKIGIDLRYERGFSNNEASFLNNNGIDISRLDTRPDQLILSLSVKI